MNFTSWIMLWILINIDNLKQSETNEQFCVYWVYKAYLKKCFEQEIRRCFEYFECHSGDGEILLYILTLSYYFMIVAPKVVTEK